MDFGKWPLPDKCLPSKSHHPHLLGKPFVLVLALTEYCKLNALMVSNTLRKLTNIQDKIMKKLRKKKSEEFIPHAIVFYSFEQSFC